MLMLSKKEHSRLIQKCLMIIEEDYMQVLGVSEIAETLGVSKNHLIREFSSQVGTSPNKYLVDFKLEKAKELLESGDFSIEIAAQAVGFSCGNYFSKVFKKRFAVTPTEFIKNTPLKKPAKLDGKLYL